MPWVKFDDATYDHPKIASLSDHAIATWFRMICWSSKHLEDGHVPDAMVPILARTERPSRVITELVAGAMLEPNGDGYEIHDYRDYQPSADAVKRRRQAEREKKRRQRGAGE